MFIKKANQEKKWINMYELAAEAHFLKKSSKRTRAAPSRFWQIRSPDHTEWFAILMEILGAELRSLASSPGGSDGCSIYGKRRRATAFQKRLKSLTFVENLQESLVTTLNRKRCQGKGPWHSPKKHKNEKRNSVIAFKYQKMAQISGECAAGSGWRRFCSGHPPLFMTAEEEST